MRLALASLLAASLVTCLGTSAPGQDSASVVAARGEHTSTLAAPPRLRAARRAWLGGLALAGSLALDEPVQHFVAAHRSGAADDVARAVDPLGRAAYLVPALVVATAIPYATGHRQLARDALRVAVGYAAADLAGGMLRVAAGRHRPDSTNDAWRFRPLHPAGEWGSLPSAHVTHAFAIATGITDASGSRWVADVAYGLATLVAADRVYQQRHWTSDVVAGAMTSVMVVRWTSGGAWLRL